VSKPGLFVVDPGQHKHKEEVIHSLLHTPTTHHDGTKLTFVYLIPTTTAGEVARLYFAHTGNLKERVPQMSAFLLITIFPQFPCVIFFAFYQEFLLPFDKSIGFLMFFMLWIELVFGVVALQGLIRRQTAQFFRLCQEEEERDEGRNKMLS